MAERVPAAALETHRARVDRAGRTDRPTVAVPVSIAEESEYVDLVIDDRTVYGTVRTTPTGGSSIRAAYDSPVDARAGPGSTAAANRLAEWVAAADLTVGRTVLVDEIVQGRVYGLRAPGTSTSYTVHERDEGLASIAESIAAEDDAPGDADEAR